MGLKNNEEDTVQLEQVRRAGITHSESRRAGIAHSESRAVRALESAARSGEQRYIKPINTNNSVIVQELCKSQGGRPEMSVLTSLLVSVDVKMY